MNNKNQADKRSGFTLVEVMVSSLIAVIVLAGIYYAYTSMYKTQAAQSIKAELQQNARNAMDTLNREISLAGYYGEVYKNAVNELQFTEYMTNHGLTQTWRVKYYLNGNNLMRQLADKDGTVWEDPTVIAEGVTSLSFAYFDKISATVAAKDNSTAYDGPSGPKYTALRTIRHIVVQVTMKSTKPDPTSKAGAPTYFYTVLQADLYPRNLAENEAPLDMTAPDAPTGLQVIDNRDCDSLELKWTPPIAPDVAGYYIMYGTQAGVYPGIVIVPVNSLADPKNPQYKLTGLVTTKYTERLLTPVKYYITMQAYDNSMNPSANCPEVSGPSDLSTDVTTFGTGTNDTVLNPKKPTVPSGFAAYNMKDSIPGGYTCGENQVRLVWNKSSDATVGYRIYRSTTPFTSYPISATYLIADEIPTYVTKLDSNSLTYLDTLPVSCTNYYYAICSINCDNTQIYGGGTQPALYKSSDYALVTHMGKDVTGPPDPDLSGSKGGWKRVFLNLVNPMLAASLPDPSCPDFSYTNLYFSDSSMPVLNSDGSVIGGQPVYDSSPEPGTPGEFTDQGSSLFNSFVFNSPTRNLDNYANPELLNDHTYYFLAVAFDRCGNHSAGTATAKTLATLCGDDPAGPPPTPTNVTVDGCGDSVTINWQWPTSSFTSWLDLQGYRVYKNTNGNFSGATDPLSGTPSGSTALVSVPLWDVTLPDTNIQDGGTYYYCVRATDCIWENIPSTDSRYATIKADNITPCLSSSIAGPIYPGRIRRFTESITHYPPQGTELYTFVTSPGVDPATFQGNSNPPETYYHNAVKFYIQNTSKGITMLNTISASWGNSAAYLSAIRVGGSPGTTSAIDYVFPTPLASTDAAGGKAISVTLNETSSTAAGIGSPSNAIPVWLVFTNSDGTISGATDMRGDQLNVKIQSTNASTGKSDCMAYMDAVHGNPINVSSTPYLYNVMQDYPKSGTVSFDVPGNVVPAHQVTDVHPVGAGNITVFVSAYVNGTEVYTYFNGSTNSTQNVGFKEKALYYTVTDQGATAPPSGATWTKLTDPIIGDNIIWIHIPGVVSSRVWFYEVTTSNSGNVDRLPGPDYGYYMYDEGTDDKCVRTPNPPGTLKYSSGTLSWNATTTYTDGGTINTYSDPLKYYIFKKVGVGSVYNYNSPYATVTAPTVSYTDPALLTNTTFYVVKTANSCATPSVTYPNLPKNISGDSNETGVCFIGGSGCSIKLTTPSVTLNSNWSSNTCTSAAIGLDFFNCSQAFNGVYNQAYAVQITSAQSAETSTVWLFEIGDSGMFTYTGTTTDTVYINSMPATYNTRHDDVYLGATLKTNLSDTLTFAVSGCTSATLSVTTDPCVNTPTAPVLSSVSVAKVSGKWNATIAWTAPTKNTDGSTIDDISYYRFYIDGAMSSVTATSSPATISNVGSGTHTYAVTAVDSCSTPHEGAKSNTITK